MAVPGGAGKRETTYHQPPCPKLRPSTRARSRLLGRAGFPSTSNSRPLTAAASLRAQAGLGARASPQRLGASWYVHCGHAGFLEEGTVRFPSKSCLGSLEPALGLSVSFCTGDVCEARHAHSRVRCRLQPLRHSAAPPSSRASASPVTTTPVLQKHAQPFESIRLQVPGPTLALRDLPTQPKSRGLGHHGLPLRRTSGLHSDFRRSSEQPGPCRSWGRAHPLASPCGPHSRDSP